MSKQWTEYVIEFVRLDGESFKPAQYIPQRELYVFTQVLQKAQRFSANQASVQANRWRANSINVKVHPVNCEIS